MDNCIVRRMAARKEKNTIAVLTKDPQRYFIAVTAAPLKMTALKNTDKSPDFETFHQPGAKAQ